MRSFLFRWFVTTVAVLAAAHIVPGIGYNSTGALLIASLVLGLVNAILKPILMLLSLPLLLFTFGLFTLVSNSAMVMLVSVLVKGFTVENWKSAFWGGVVISLVTILLKALQSPPRVQVSSQVRPPPESSKDRTIDI